MPLNVSTADIHLDVFINQEKIYKINIKSTFYGKVSKKKFELKLENEN